jgi:predicted phosphoribosyltransferase
MTPMWFANREDAGSRLAERFAGVSLVRPLVLGIPRGGIEVGAPLARALGAELDVVLSRKLGAPGQPELALGAVSETGEMHLELGSRTLSEPLIAYLEHERARQLAELERRMRLFRTMRPKADITGRSVIVTDDGIATGSTMFAALATVRAQAPRELIVAVPVAPGGRLAAFRPLCQRLICLYVPEEFGSVGEFYDDFREVSDQRVELLLRGPGTAERAPGATGGRAGDRTGTSNS